MRKKSTFNKFVNTLKKRLLYVFIFVFSTLLLILPLYFKDQLHYLGAFGLFGLFLINLLGSATIFVPAPVILSVGVAGNIYNPLIVALVSSLGSSLGESTGFLFGHSTRELFKLKHDHKLLYKFFIHIFHKHGAIVIILFSIIPNPLIDGIGIFAGFTGYSLKKFILLVFIGRLIRNIFVAYLGHAL